MKELKRMKFVLIHGTFGNGEENWFPWLKKNLEEQGHEVIIPTFPTPENQSLENWMSIFEEYREKLDEDTILIGHSLGPAFILSVLEQINVKVKGCILVAGFLNLLGNKQFDNLNKTFVEKEFNWGKIRENSEQFYVLQSKDDPYVPFEEGIQIARNLKTLPIPYENFGHFNSAAEFDTFEDVLRLCYVISNQKKVQVNNLVGFQSIPEKSVHKNKAVILFHGFGTNKHEWGRYDYETYYLTKEGYSVFRFDCTGRGESEGDYSLTSIDVMAQDLDRICEYVYEKLEFEKYTIISQSMGTNAAIVSELKTVSALIQCASISDIDKYLTPIFKTVDKKGISKRVSSMGEKMDIKRQYWDAYEKYDLLDEVSKIKLPN